MIGNRTYELGTMNGNGEMFAVLQIFKVTFRFILILSHNEIKNYVKELNMEKRCVQIATRLVFVFYLILLYRFGMRKKFQQHGRSDHHQN